MTLFQYPRAQRILDARAKREAECLIKAAAEARVRAATGGEQRQSGYVMGGGTSVNSRTSTASDTPTAQARAAAVEAERLAQAQPKQRVQARTAANEKAAAAWRAYNDAYYKNPTDPNLKVLLFNYAKLRGYLRSDACDCFACGWSGTPEGRVACLHELHSSAEFVMWADTDCHIREQRIEHATCKLLGVKITPECGRWDC